MPPVASENRAQPATDARPRVLIVDDQPANVFVLSEALRDRCELFFATSGPAALEVLERQPIDLALLDVSMPEMDGFELCRRMKAGALTSKVPVIFVTARGEVEDETQGFEAGGVDYITKPISPATVRARVRTHLELSAARRRLEQQNAILAENLALKEDVERISRHDLKTPLTSIIATPELLMTAPGLSPEQVELLRGVERAGYRILEMINRSLDLFKMEKGSYAFQPQAVDVLDVLQRVVADLTKTAAARRVGVRVPASIEAAPLAWAEELLSYSMFANVVKNAIEASPAGADVVVTCERADAEVVVRVHNRGAVPEKVRATFFDKYSSAGKAGGTGLGTYSARLMAETQRGRIAMTTDEATGTTLEIRLPVARDVSAARPDPGARPVAAAAPASAEPGAAPLDGLRVLIVDDDEDNRRMLENFVAGTRARVESAGDGGSALEKLRALEPEVVLLDVEMPVMGGLEALARIRNWESQAHRGEPAFLVALSSHDDPEVRARAFVAGCDRYLSKPVTRQTVIELLREAASRHQGAAEDSAEAAAGASQPVWLDADISHLVPGFLDSRRRQLRELQDVFAAGDLVKTGRLAHKLRGGFAMYGFSQASELCKTIERAAADGDARPIPRMLEDLRSHVDAVEVRYRER
jgi:CheY-like chemotaxis protein/HPt (histidine-containing phosphotransfer) domain-containing protein